jgi:hypothetical protein
MLWMEVFVNIRFATNWLLSLVLFLITACGGAPAKASTAASPTVEALLTPTPTLTRVDATSTFQPPPTDLCREYLHLSVLHGEAEAEGVATSYRCHSATIDSTGQYPSRSPELVVHRNTPITVQLSVEQQPSAIDVRLYPGAGVSASFLRWPEELPTQVEAVDRAKPEIDVRFQYLPQALPGPYSLVVKVTWGEAVEVYYAISFMLEDAIK